MGFIRIMALLGLSTILAFGVLYFYIECKFRQNDRQFEEELKAIKKEYTTAV